MCNYIKNMRISLPTCLFKSFYSSNLDEDDDIFGTPIKQNEIPKLSEACLLKINRGSEEIDLTVQVLKYVWLPERSHYRLHISDGKYFIAYANLDKSCSHLIQENLIDTFCIIKINR